MSKKKQKQKPAPCQRGFASRPRQEKRFDAQGRRIGDDGLPMTKYRTRAHRLLNGFFVWGAFAGLLCAGFTVLATFQGQELSSWELVAEGGAYRNGLSIATLLRFEAMFCLAVGIASVAVHLYGFSWLYDGYALRPARRIALGLGLACAAWCATAVLLAGAFEPVSVATLVLLATFRLLVPKIHDEHQQLLSMRS